MKKIVFVICVLLTQFVLAQECVNVKFKLRGYFYAGTSQIDSTAAGGFYKAENSPKS